MSKTFDLTTLNLSAGTHKITVKARASGYEDSPASDPVSYVVAGDTPNTPTDGLAYTLSADGTYYTCTGIGTATETDIVIANEIDGLPVKSIGYRAFRNCSSLTSVVIPDSVTTIGSSAFAYCENLTGIQYNATECADLSKNNYIFADAGQNGEGITVTIGANVKKIPAYMFDSSSYAPKIVGVIFEEGSVCESIGYRAFAYCENLTSVEIPDSVTSIGSYAFYSCDGLTSVVIPDSVTSIGSYAFYFCKNLTSVVIPDSVTSIGDWAFGNCDGLASVIIPDSVTSIGNNAFTDTAYYKDGSNWENGVLYIGRHLIEAKPTLSGSYQIKEGTLCIADEAFSACTSLTSISVSKDSTAYRSIDGNLYTKDGSILVQYAMGKTDTTFTIPDSVTSIGFYAFSNCASLTSIVIPDSVISIERQAFYKCISLTSIVIPDSATSVGAQAFLYCASLTSIVIGNSVTSIGVQAFGFCTSLSSIAFNGTKAQWTAITKGVSWNDRAIATYVQCTDGTVSI